MKYFTKNKLHNIEKSKVIVLKYKDNSLDAFKYINTTLYDFLK